MLRPTGPQRHNATTRLSVAVSVVVTTLSILSVGVGRADIGSACADSYTCIYQNKNYNQDVPGRQFNFQNLSDVSIEIDFSAVFNDQMTSWINLRHRSSRWYVNVNRTGGSYCMVNGTRNPLLPVGQNDLASAIVLYGDDRRC